MRIPPLYLVTCLMLLLSPASMVSGEHENQESNFWYNRWMDGLVYQNPFCMVASDAIDPTTTPDIRYNVHSFAVVHHKLYIFGGTYIFEVDLDESAPEPPYHVNKSLQFTDLSAQLSNLLYDTQHTASRLFTTVAFELNHHQEVFFIGSSAFTDDFVDEWNQPFRTLTTALRSHTDVILRDLTDPYKQPDEFEYDFSAYFTDTNSDTDGVAVQVPYNRSRFISADGYFFHVSRDKHDLLTIVRYQVNSSEQSLVELSPVEWFLYEHATDQWLLTSNKQAENESKLADSADRSILGKNGFISRDRMYLSRGDYLEVYNLTQQSMDRVVLTFERFFPAYELVVCQLAHHESGAMIIYFALTLLAFVSVVICFMVTRKLSTQSGAHFVVHRDLTLTLVDAKLLKKVV